MDCFVQYRSDFGGIPHHATIVNKVVDHGFSFEIVCRSLIDSLNLLVVLEGVKGIGDSHNAVLSGRIHTKSTRRSISWMRRSKKCE